MCVVTEPLQAKLAQVRERISAAARAASRDPGEVVLLAVSKTFPAAAVIEAAAAGQTRFGENYVQEALDKIAAVHAQASRLHLEWHFIGPIQSNKTRAIAEHFDWVQSVDRLKIAQRLSEQRPPALPPLNVLVQVNISAETSKSGVAPEQAAELVRAVAALPRLRLRGLMAIPAPTPGADAQRRACAQLRALFEQLRTQLRRDLQPDAAAAFDTLSMGMSDDLEAAIAEGSTMVRIGTAIFGTRVKGGAA